MLSGSLLLLFLLVSLRLDGASRPAKQTPSQAKLTADQIRQAEQLLNDLGYWIGKIDGQLDPASVHGLIAFQKVEGRPRTGKLTLEEIEVMKAAHQPEPLERGYDHVEVDLKRQVLFIVSEVGPVRVLPVSTGSGEEFTSEGFTRRAVTPTGRFKIYRKIKGSRKSPLGLLYYPSYFLDGVAIHGNPLVPVQPASHGCIRIPMFAAQSFSELCPIGTPLIVHDGEKRAPSDEPVPTVSLGTAD